MLMIMAWAVSEVGASRSRSQDICSRHKVCSRHKINASLFYPPENKAEK